MLIYMSLVTLKKKSRNNRRFAPISGRGNNGFSLNGTHRNHGGVGAFRMISNTTRTPFRGSHPMGNGGSNGKYYDNPLNSGSCCTNDNSIVKKSTLNTAGMIDTKYKWMKSAYPNYWVQEDDNSYTVTRDQGTYIRNRTQSNGSCVFSNAQSNARCGNNVVDDQDPYIYNCSGNKNSCSYFIGTKKYIRTPYAKNFNQLPVSQSQYIKNGGLFKKYCLPTPANKAPFPMKLNHNNSSHAGCQVNFLTPQQAISAGVLPSDWM